MEIPESKRHTLSGLIKRGIAEAALPVKERSLDPGIYNFETLLTYVKHTELTKDAGFNKATLSKKLAQPQLMKIAECMKLAAVLYVTPQEVMTLALNEISQRPPKKAKAKKAAAKK
ncbi:hypothetical protein ACTJJB_14500 [Chitinophaga sp. 22536]|uniref:hypothetical protein n=1 Tax=unclassified Chitinophaga TaxID=2619133 RepID=UPI003F861E7A